MKQVIKYAALLFALVLAASIIGGCLTAGVSLVQGLYDEFSFPEELEGRENSLWYRDENGDVFFLGMQFGDSGEVKSGSETFNGSEIDSMYIEVGSGELIVEAWDNTSVSVVYENIPEEYEIVVDDKTLNIEKEDRITFFGITSFMETPKIHVSVPADLVFNMVEIDKGSGSAKINGIAVEDFIVDNGSGGITISDIVAEECEFNSGSGSFVVQNSNLGEPSIDTGSGFVNLENVTAKNLVLDTGSGRVDVSGILTGNCVFESGSGSLNVVVYGDEEDYNFRTDMGSGSFYLNGKKEDNDYDKENKRAKYLLVFDAGSGRVSLEFDKTKSVNEGTPNGANYER